jgi:hypothetical protein
MKDCCSKVIKGAKKFDERAMWSDEKGGAIFFFFAFLVVQNPM